ILMKNTLAIFCLAFGGSLLSCANSEGSANPTASLPAGLAGKLVASWKADTTITLTMGISAIDVGVATTVTIASNQTFTATIDASTPLGAIEGPLFTESGTWAAKSLDTVVLRPTVCKSADTATTTFTFPPLTASLPFHQAENKFVANSLTTTPCPDSVLITTAPVRDTLRMTMPINVPLQGRSTWTMAFKKQP
ncbi:MAG: hypothetical protein AAB214_18660, partial [Fibrobacterota bacterium]